MDSRVSKWASSYCLSGDTEEIQRFLSKNEMTEEVRKAYVEHCLMPRRRSGRVWPNESKKCPGCGKDFD